MISGDNLHINCRLSFLKFLCLNNRKKLRCTGQKRSYSVGNTNQAWIIYCILLRTKNVSWLVVSVRMQMVTDDFDFAVITYMEIMEENVFTVAIQRLNYLISLKWFYKNY